YPMHVPHASRPPEIESAPIIGSGRGLRMPARVGWIVACSLAALLTRRTVGVRAAAPAASPVVYSAEVDSIIHPVSAESMMTTMDRADRDRAALVVFTLRTPGGLVDSTHTIVSHMFAARTPVVVFVAPSGSRAASAGFLITIAADIAAMAPGTHIGAAHP